MQRKQFILAALMMLVQYYDYHLFGFLAANLADYFLPSADFTNRIIYTYLIMFAAMAAKPFGAIILGRIGDIKGRYSSFKVSLRGNIMAAICIFFLPAYEKIGLAACFLLLIYRMIVCSLVSSGADGIRIYIYEHIAIKWRCSGVAITTLFAQAGSLLASLSAWFFTLNYFTNYSWKLAFLLGGVLGFILFIFTLIYDFNDKNSSKEDESFIHYQNFPLRKLIAQHRKLFLLNIIIAGTIGGMNQFVIIFFGTYHFKILQIIDQSLMQYYVSLAVMMHMLFSLIAGYLADVLQRYYVINFGIIVSLILSIILAINLAEHQFNLLNYLILVASLPFITMPALAILKKSMAKAVRYRLFALTHALGSIFISAPTALIATCLYHYTGLSWLPIIYFINLLLMISCSLYLIRNY